MMQLRVPIKDIFYIFVQLLLFILFFSPIHTKEDSGAGMTWRIIGMLLTATGSMVLIFALVQLNKNLTPFPSPKESGKLVQTGLYKYIRHPIYSGILLLATGISFYYCSVWKLTITGLLVILFYFKSVYEEVLLSKKYIEYVKYKENTGRFLPLKGF
jgi:protein-S-isoprenylcysteine O-methyltransferase Ste14